MHRVAVIDIGSKSVKCFVGEKRTDGSVSTLLDANDITSLGEGLSRTGRIGADALERTAQAVSRFSGRAEALGAERVEAVGTMALRSAENSADFTARVRALCGLGVQILPGEEEARLSYRSVLTGLDVGNGRLVIFDTGGGSTEFIYGHGGTLEKRFSIDLGVNRITEAYFPDDPVKPGSVDAALSQIRAELMNAGVGGSAERLIGIGGAVTGMSAVKHRLKTYDPAVVHGSVLTSGDVEWQLRDFESKTLEERRQIPGVQPKRADVLLAGACIVKAILDRFGAASLTVSDRGLRHGLAWELLGQ